MRSLSIDLRKRVIAFVQGGGSKLAAAEQYNVSRNSVYRWLALLEKTGDLAVEKGKKPGPKGIDEAELRAYIAAHPEAYCREIAVEFGVWPQAISRACKRFGITRKKKRSFASKPIRSRK